MGLSGKDLGERWRVRPSEDLPDGAALPAGVKPRHGSVGTPLRYTPADGGEPLVISTHWRESFTYSRKIGDGGAKQQQAPARMWVEAREERSGETRWKTRLAGVPDATRLPAVLARQKAGPVVLALCGRAVHRLGPGSGKLLASSPLAFAPSDQFDCIDLDGDGSPELLLLDESKGALHAVSVASGASLWQHPLPRPSAVWRGQERGRLAVLAESEPGGKVRVVVPAELGAVEVLEGATGQVRWRREVDVRRGQSDRARFISGPDLDGDGIPELFVANVVYQWHSYRHANDNAWTWVLHEPTVLVAVRALSGATGRPLWHCGHSFPQPVTFAQRWESDLVWWGRGSDGLPRLLVPGRTTLAVEVGRGHVAQTLAGLRGGFQVADIDGDGLADLLGYEGLADSSDTRPGRLHGWRGTPDALWQRLGRWRPIGDRDGDGVEDLMRERSESPLVSGRTGKLLQPVEGAGSRPPRRPPADVALLISVEEGHLVARDPERKAIRWRLRVPASSSVKTYLKGEAGPALAVVDCPGEEGGTVLGVDTDRGTVVWRCPGARWDGNLLQRADHPAWPLVLREESGRTRCSLVVPAQTQDADSVAFPESESGEWHRTVVPLPWTDKLTPAEGGWVVLFLAALLPAHSVYRWFLHGWRGLFLPGLVYLLLLVLLPIVYLYLHGYPGSLETWERYSLGGAHRIFLLALVFAGLPLLWWWGLRVAWWLLKRIYRLLRRLLGREVSSTPVPG